MPGDLLAFFHALENLKKTKRTGWIERGVKLPESVSDHSFRMAVMALALAEQLKCNQKKLVELCLVHDLPEAVCGDLVLDWHRFGGTFKGIPFEEKKEREKKAKNELFSQLDSEARKHFESIWNEFEKGKSREAQIARQFDKFEMVLQAFEYHRDKNFEKELWPVWLTANEKHITEPVLKKMLRQLGSETEKTY